MASPDGLMKCNCSDPNCPLMICVTCWCPDCKWPGECKGKCRECGGPARPLDLAPHLEDAFDCYCGDECTKIAWDRGIADGTIVSLSDLTPEQVNAEFNKIGLALEGVGERKPS